MEPQPTPLGAPSRQLRRSRSDRVVGGVCGGLARYLGVDSVLVRIAFVVLVVFGGSGLVLYVLAWLIIPEESGVESDQAPPPGPDSATTGRLIVGAILVAIGGLMFADRFIPAMSAAIGPLLLVGVGLVVLFLAVGRPAATSPAAAGSTPTPPPDPGARVVAPPTGEPRAVAPPTGEPQGWEPEPSGAPGRILLGGLLVLGGLLWLLDLSGAVSLDWRVLLPVALVVVGLVTMVLAWTGQRTGGLVAWGVLLSVVVITVSMLPDRLSATVGDRVERPGSIEQLAPDYALGIGKLTVDLRDLDLDRPRTVEASVGIGELVVLVPAEVALDVTGRVGAGEVVALDRASSGVSVHLRARFAPPDQAAVSPILTLDLSVGLGKIEVRR